MWSKAFWADLLERSVRAAVWALLAALAADATGTITGVDWPGALNVAGYAFALATLGSLAGSKAGAKDSASFLPRQFDPPKPKRRRDAGDIGAAVAVLILFVILAAALGTFVNHWLFLLVLLAFVALVL